MLRNLFLSLVLSGLILTSASAQVVVLGTKEGGRIAGLDFGRQDLVRYDIEYDSASIFVSSPILEDLGSQLNLDALHVNDEGDLFFSTRGNISIDGQSFRHTDIVRISASTNEASLFYRSDNDIAGFELLPNGNFLISTKVDTIIAGENFETGNIVEVIPATNTASTFFDASNFFTIENGGTYLKGNIDTINLLPNGNLLLSTTNTAEIGTTAEDAVRVFQSGVHEYDSTTGSVTTYLDPSVFESASVDVKAFSVLSPVSILLLGDCNIDGVVDFSDIGSLVELLLIGSVGGNGSYLVQADCNLDGEIDFFDAPLFVTILMDSLGIQ